MREGMKRVPEGRGREVLGEEEARITGWVGKESYEGCRSISRRGFLLVFKPEKPVSEKKGYFLHGSPTPSLKRR